MESTVKSPDFSKTSLTTSFAKETPEIGLGKGPINKILFYF